MRKDVMKKIMLVAMSLIISFTVALHCRELAVAVFINAKWAVIGILPVFVPALIKLKSHEVD